MGIMDSLSDSFETSLSQQQISSLVRMQLNDGDGWNILSSRVVGTGNDTDYTCYSSGDQILYVMLPDENSVSIAADYINRIKNGETLTQEEIAAGMKN